jgi:signal transduction histidine kinase
VKSGYHALVLRVLSWLARLGAFVLIGFGIFLGSDVSAALLIAQIAGFAASGVLMALWALADFREMPGLRTWALALVRAVQEALVNAAKHAGQQPVDVTLRYADHDVQVTISNPLGASSEFSTADTGYGLTGMRERLLLLRGTLTEGADDGRWTLQARVPV